MKLTQWFGLAPEDLEGPLDGSGGPGGPTGDTGEPDLAQQTVMARRKRVCPCCHGAGEHASGFECYRCDASGTVGGFDDPGPGGCDGNGGTMSATASEHVGEPSYEEDDGYGRSMWDRWHPNLPGTIHRALAVKIPADHPAHDASLPMHERAHALLGDLSGALDRHHDALGMHWTSDPGHLRKHLADRISPGETPVMLHAKTPPREHIEDNGWVHEDRAIRDWDTEEREVPVKRNAPLHITGISWGGNHHDFAEPITKRAGADPVHAEEDPANIHRGLTVVLPPDVHKMVHDRAQPVASRAHMLLAHVRKEHPEISSEEAHGSTGGLGNFWSPIKDKGAEYADQTGYHAYRTHEREHNCGDEHDASGGCPTTNVVIHAGEPHPKHQWKEVFRPGEEYRRDLSWRLPVRPGAPLHVKGISWREGNDHEPRDYSKSIAEQDKRGPYTEHDFPSPVHKRAMATDWGRHYPDLSALHRGMGVTLPKALHAYVHDENEPRDERAAALLAHVQKRPYGRHWSADPDIGKSFATQYARRDPDEPDTHATPVVIHARVPDREHIQTDPDMLRKYRIRDFDQDSGGNYEMEVPLKRGTPVDVSGISWANPASYSEGSGKHRFSRHYFDEPAQHRAGWSDNAVPSGQRGRDHQGHEVEMTPQDGWAHLDGSHSEDDGSTVTDHPVTPYEHVHTWLPQGKYWGPNSKTLDQRLFQGDHLRPEIRQDVLAKVDSYLRSRYTDWPAWTRVYFAGSQAAQWLDDNGEGNGDFDVLIGIDWPVFHQLNLKVPGTDEQIAQQMTTGMWHTINKDGDYFTLKGGRRVGPFDRTFFVNPRAWDITAIKPYAAYDVTRDRWAVHPLKVPTDWSAHSLPESYWGYAEALEKLIDAIGELPPEERHRQAANLWEDLHSHRSDAFGLGGKGLYDIANVLEKYLDQSPGRPWARLVQWKSESPSGAEPWVPTTARRSTLTTIFTEAEVRHEVRDPQSGADYDGIMVALVPPEAVCESLVVDKGEPAASMHVTLAYLGGKKEYTKEQVEALPDLVKGWAHGREPLKASVGGVGTFVNPDRHVLWAAVDIPYGTVFRDDLVRHLEGHGYNIRHDHGWTPHITLAYRSSHVRFLPKVKPASWKNDQIWVCIGGRWESFPIGA